jgi:hypothetical protein
VMSTDIPIYSGAACAAFGIGLVRDASPEEVVRQWHRAIRRVKEETGVLPTWVCAVILIEVAVREWRKQDPEAKPTEARVLERDGYLCQAPGCSSRKDLQIHHVRYRSRGGTDHAWNKSVLCFAHHQICIHENGEPQGGGQGAAGSPLDHTVRALEGREICVIRASRGSGGGKRADQASPPRWPREDCGALL